MTVTTDIPSRAKAVIDSRMPTLSGRCGGAKTLYDSATGRRLNLQAQAVWLVI